MFERSNVCMLWVAGHMAQMGKKNLTLFQALRKKKAAKARAAGALRFLTCKSR